MQQRLGMTTLAVDDVRRVTKPEKVFWGGYSGYAANPGGHLLETAFNPFWELDEAGAVVMPSGQGMNSLEVKPSFMPYATIVRGSVA